jgi:hypothetical protein
MITDRHLAYLLRVRDPNRNRPLGCGVSSTAMRGPAQWAYGALLLIPERPHADT